MVDLGGPIGASHNSRDFKMVLRLKITLAFAATALMAVLVSVTLAARG
jgi:hypothetical protein